MAPRSCARSSSATTADSGDVAPSPESAVVALEDRAQLLGAINRLREEDRLVIACRYFLDLSTEETAAAIGCPTGTVKSRLSRALDRLKQLYEVSRVLARKST